MKKILNSKDFQAWSGMIIGSLVYCIGIVFVLDLGKFYAGGVTGVAQIVTTLCEKGFNEGAVIVGLKSAIIVAINIPLFLIGWRGVSKRFAFVSLGSVILQTGVIALLELLQKNGFNPFLKMSGESNMLTLSIIGGLLTGLGGGICLRNGASTGGMDILSQYMAFKKKISFSKFTLIIDLVIIVLAYFVGGNISVAVYTVVRMIVYVITLDKMHTIYNYVKVSIVTENVEKVKEEVLKKCNHACTIYTAEGGYSGRTKYVLEIIMSNFETFPAIAAARAADPACFITQTAIKKIEGKFNVQTIA